MLVELFRKILAYRQRERSRSARLEELFQARNVIRSNSSGKQHEVLSVHLGAVWLRSLQGEVWVLDLMTPAGTLRTEVADRWSLSQSAVAR